MSYGEPLKNKGESIWDLSEFEGRDSVDLLARMIYGEARGESKKGKRGVAHVAKNRKDKNKKYLGGNTYAGVILKKYQFEGMTTKAAREPDLSSQAWEDCLDIASNMSTTDNPIGDRLYFVAKDYYDKYASDDRIDLGGGKTDVLDKLVIGNHVFFNV